MKKSLPAAILISGLIVGTADITCACLSAWIQKGISPETVLRYVASGIYGSEAFTGGSSMPVMGLIFHYIIAFSFTILFFFLYPKLEWMRKNKILTAVLYGIFMWAITTRIVLPLSNVKTGPFNLVQALLAIAILVIAIGIPLGYLAGNFYESKKEQTE
ncbi:MAG: hypothetical protein QM791_11420 [Ferruginibacter sp.]